MDCIVHGVATSRTYITEWHSQICIRASQVVLEVKNPPANAGDMWCEFDPRVRKMPWRGTSVSLQYPCLENPMDRGAWQATVHKVAQSWMWQKWLSMHACMHSDLYSNPSFYHPPAVWPGWDSNLSGPQLPWGLLWGLHDTNYMTNLAHASSLLSLYWVLTTCVTLGMSYHFSKSQFLDKMG